MNYARVLMRDSSGREVLWQCSDCGSPFILGWGSRCNRCIREAERHEELMRAITASKQVRL